MDVDITRRRTFFDRIRIAFNVDAVALSYLVRESTILTHQVLTHSLQDLETISVPKDPLVVVIPVITRSEVISCPSISRTNGRMDCPIMRAEGLEAILAIPVKDKQFGSAALSLLNAEPRIWNKAEAEQFKNYAKKMELDRF